MSDLNELRKIAEAEETQKWGGWAFEEDDFDGFCIYINDGDDFGRSYVAKDLTQGESEGESTAEFIATFDPPTVLALLSRLEQAEQDRVKLRNRLDAMRRQRDGYRNQLRKTEQQVARVREVLGEARESAEEILERGIDNTEYTIRDQARADGYLQVVHYVTRALDGDTRG